jgi:hypothetical protein
MSPARIGGNDVQHAGLQVVIELELQGVGGGIHIHSLVLGAVLDDALVAISPGLLEQRALDVTSSLASRISTLLLGLALLK